MEINNTEVIFRSKEHLQDCVQPFASDSIIQFLEGMQNIKVSFDPDLKERKVVPLKAENNLFFATLFQGEDFSIHYPQSPRVPHQLSIAFNHGIKSIENLDSQALAAFFNTLKKINEIYLSKLHIDGYVLAQYSDPQPRHDGSYTVEILPHQPGLEGCRDFLDKADSNRYVLYGDQGYTPVQITHSQEEFEQEVEFWKNELAISQTSLTDEQTAIDLPAQRMDSHFESGKELALYHLLEYFENNGAQVINKPLKEFIFSKEDSIDPKIWTTASCAFCREEIINRQKAFEYNDVYILYNFRKMPYEGTSFLILPKRHTEKIYTLNQEEINTIHLLKKALISVLKEKFPDFEVVIYNQDNLSVGQTVPHTHDQVVAIDPEKIAMHWSMLSLAYNPSSLSGVSQEEMQRVTQEFSHLLEKKVCELTLAPEPIEEAI